MRGVIRAPATRRKRSVPGKERSEMQSRPRAQLEPNKYSDCPLVKSVPSARHYECWAQYRFPQLKQIDVRPAETVAAARPRPSARCADRARSVSPSRGSRPAHAVPAEDLLVDIAEMGQIEEVVVDQLVIGHCRWPCGRAIRSASCATRGCRRRYGGFSPRRTSICAGISSTLRSGLAKATILRIAPPGVGS